MPPDELAALYQTRARLRVERATKVSVATTLTLGKSQGVSEFSFLGGALADYTEALALLAVDDAREEPLADPAALPQCFLGRAEVERRLGNRWSDVNRDLESAEDSLDRLPRVAQTNPFLYQQRSDARSRLGLWGAAAEDALEAEAQFNLIGVLAFLLRFGHHHKVI